MPRIVKFRQKLTAGLILLFAAAAPAFALDLQQGRSQGVVGEQLDGFLAPLKPTPESQQLVQEVNARRRAEYARISAQNGQPVEVVGKLAAEQIITKLPSGAMYQATDGSWKKR